MNGSLKPEPVQTLQSRRDTIGERLYKALARTSFVPLETTQVRQRLAELVAQIIALLVAEPFEPRQAETIGASFVRLHYTQPESLGQIQEVLARGLVEALPAEQVAGLQPRLAALLGGVAAGFLQQTRDTILAEQKQTHQALLSAQEQAVAALHQSEQVTRALFDAVTDPAMLLEPDGTIAALNQAMAERLNKPAEELCGRCMFNLLPPDVAAFRKAKCDQVLRSGQPMHFTDQRGGRWFDHTIYPAFDSHGQVTRLAVFARDTTERRRTIRAMRRQAERLRVLHRVDTAILTAQSPEEITKTVLNHLRPLIFFLGAGVVLFDFEAHEGVVLYAEVASAIQIPPGMRFSLDTLPGIEAALKALDQGEVFASQKILTLAQAIPALQTLHAEGMRAALLVPLIAQDELIGIFALGTDRLDVFGESQVRTIREFADALAIALQQARLFQSVKRQGEQLRALSAQLAEADETERRRLARELHDQVGQNLTALGINLNLIRAHLPPETLGLVRDRLDDSLALVEETTVRVRLVMADLRPPMLDDFGLVATLQWHGARFASHLGVTVTVTGEEPIPRLAAQMENALFRIAQEALANVAKHAQATQVTIAVKADHKIVRLMIADDGIGFDPTAPAKPDGDRGWGLITIAERAEAVGGHCRIESKPRQGTRVIVEVTR